MTPGKTTTRSNLLTVMAPPSQPDASRSDLLMHLVDQILLVDLRGLLGRTAGVGDAIELDDRPAAEMDIAQRGKDAGQIHAAAAQLDELIGRAGRVGWAGARWRRAHVLE